MNYLTVEVAIDHGRVVLRKPRGALPDNSSGLLTFLQPVSTRWPNPKRARQPR